MKLIRLILLLILLSGCAQTKNIFNQVYGDPIVHTGKVTGAEYWDKYTAVDFDNVRYILIGYQYVIIGETVSIKLTGDGYKIANY
jgi:hypothetical protein